MSLRKSKLNELAGEIATAFLDNPGLTDIDYVLDQHRIDLSVPNSSKKFRINKNVALWKSFMSNSTHEVAIYFVDDKLSSKAYGKTFNHEFIEFDPTRKEEAFLNGFTR